MSSAEYRLIGADGAVLEAGSGDVTVAGGVLELRPADGSALRVPPGRIASVAEPEPFVVLVRIADGSALELSRLGRMRTQLLGELGDARAGVAAAESGVLGDPVRFSGTVAASPVDLHVFEDALLVMAGGRAKRIAFSFVAGVRARDEEQHLPIERVGAELRSKMGWLNAKTAPGMDKVLAEPGREEARV